jgi:hypothetical protein
MLTICLSVVLVLGLSGGALAVDWDGGGGNNRWDNPIVA